jgi:hypothetical protein
MKNTFFIACFFCLLMIMFLSCRKESDRIIIAGKVMDTTGTATIADVEMELARTEIAGSTYSAGYKSLANCCSGSDGSYWFETTFAKTVSYRIKTKKAGYFDNENFIPGSVVLVDDVYNMNVYMQPTARISIRVKNQNPYNQNDSIAWWYGGHLYNCEDCCSDIHFFKKGSSVDTTITCTTAGNRWARIQYAYRKSTNHYYVSDSVYCPAHQTTLYEITY